MKTKKLLSLVVALAMLVGTMAVGSFSAFAEVKVSESNGVVAMVDTSSEKTRYVYYPKTLESSSKSYPAIIWANGTGCDPSMYVDLFNAFAKQGYVVVASSETMAADGTDQSANASYILAKSKEAGALYNKINPNKLVAMGHSQGGRSAVNAAAADARFRCVVSIAGSNYTDEAEKLSAPTFFITGTSDFIVSSKKWVKPAYDVCKGPAVYASLKKAVHTTCTSSPEQYVKYSVKWIKAWVDNDKASLQAFAPNGELAKDDSWQDVESKKLGVTAVSKPKATSLSKLTPAAKAVKISWKKASGVAGYQLQLATDKSFKKNKKTVTVKGASTTKKTVSGLKKGKAYYVRIRTYKSIGGSKIYSKWSKANTVKVK